MPLLLISAMCYGQVPTRNAEKAEITYRVINPANRTVGVGVGAIDSTAIDPFFLGDVTIPEVIYSNNEMFKVVGISDYAFKDCNGIKRVDLGYNISVSQREDHSRIDALTDIPCRAVQSVDLKGYSAGCTVQVAPDVVADARTIALLSKNS